MFRKKCIKNKEYDKRQTNKWIKQKTYKAIMLIFLLSGLTGCVSRDSNTHILDSSESSVIEETKEDIKEETTEEKKIEESAAIQHNIEEEELRKEAYQSILLRLYQNNILGDREYGSIEEAAMAENKFAVYDVDLDGKQELIICYTSTFMAGMIEVMYDYDSKSNMVLEEFAEFPALTYYDNGIIRAEWSHNQGLAGEFWPYTLYQYEKETDQYKMVGMVDAWDKSLREVDYDGNTFPDQIDLNGDGVIYYIMLDGEYKLTEPVDLEAYERWLNSYIGEAAEIKIPFLNVTEENIDKVKSVFTK